MLSWLLAFEQPGPDPYAAVTQLCWPYAPHSARSVRSSAGISTPAGPCHQHYPSTAGNCAAGTSVESGLWPGQQCAAGQRDTATAVLAWLAMDFVSLAACNQLCCRQRTKAEAGGFFPSSSIPHEEKVRGDAGSQCSLRSDGQSHTISSKRHNDSSITEPGHEQLFNNARLYKNCFNWEPINVQTPVLSWIRKKKDEDT